MLSNRWRRASSASECETGRVAADSLEKVGRRKRKKLGFLGERSTPRTETVHSLALMSSAWKTVAVNAELNTRE